MTKTRGIHAVQDDYQEIQQAAIMQAAMPVA